MKSEYTRDIGPEMMKRLRPGGDFSPFVDAVKQHDNLALCFRGNDKPNGMVTIYRKNHCIWNLFISTGKSVVTISQNHMRFMQDWKTRVLPSLLKIGFTTTDKMLCRKTNTEILESSEIVKRTKRNHGYEYSLINLQYICNSLEETKIFIKDSYELLCEIQDEYFNSRQKVTKTEQKPTNYFKKFFFERNADAEVVDMNSNMYASFQTYLEKYVQQELFLLNHKINAGVFIYDLEFMQPSRPDITVTRKNKPDMFGIRFAEDGSPEAIAMIEVKSTKSALKQNSGIKSHLNGMESYLGIKTDQGYIMDDRRKEACRILNQYHDLDLYGIKRTYREEEFASLKCEIIFVFTNTVADKSIKVDESHTIEDILNEYEEYSGIQYGALSKRALILKKEYK